MFLCTSKVHSDREIPCVVRALKEEERRAAGWRGREGQGPSYKALNSCSACSRSFPASLIGERIQGRDRKGQAGKSGLL